MNKNMLLQPFQSSHLNLQNRVAMAPLTRCRAGEGNTVNDMIVRYYEQRAGAGLIISEGSQISPMAVGYPDTPGIHTAEQVESWKKVTEAVHRKEGRIFIQLWHVGRISHPNFLGGKLPLAPSAIKPAGLSRTKQGKLPHPVPKAITIDEIDQTIEDYSNAARNAMEAGFDGVEIHGANGYLINQFLCDSTNHRTDDYGGSIENRCRFALEVTKAVCNAIGNKFTGIRLSPGGIGQDITDSDLKSLFGYLINALNDYDLAFLHLLEPYEDLSHIPNAVQHIAEHFRPIYNGTLMINNGFTLETANAVIEKGLADLVSFGKLFISNPDLVERFRLGAPLNDWDTITFYSAGPKGYIDYPMLGE
jgi:N-ethylmaleimide reductase